MIRRVHDDRQDMEDIQRDKKWKRFNREPDNGCKHMQIGTPGLGVSPIVVFLYLYFCLPPYLYCVCSVTCDYAKYQILYLVNAKSHRSIHLLFMRGGVYLSSFCFISGSTFLLPDYNFKFTIWYADRWIIFQRQHMHLYNPIQSRCSKMSIILSLDAEEEHWVEKFSIDKNKKQKPWPISTKM